MRILASWLLCIAASYSLSAQCFLPLANPKSSNPAEWVELKQFTPPPQLLNQKDIVKAQKITDGDGNINLDYYEVTFQKKDSAANTFKMIRSQFGYLAHSEEGLYETESDKYFHPYQASTDPNDPVFARNQKLWLSNDPTGALMSFILASTNPPAFSVTFKGVRAVMEQGDVLVTCATSTDFIFSTMKTVNGGFHPVNGNRGFGIRDNGNNTLTFYTKGADRLPVAATVTDENGVAKNVGYLGNFILESGVMPGYSGPDAVFQAGHQFWLEFFGNLTDLLRKRGATVVNNSFIANSHRYAYP